MVQSTRARWSKLLPSLGLPKQKFGQPPASGQPCSSAGGRRPRAKCVLSSSFFPLVAPNECSIASFLLARHSPSNMAWKLMSTTTKCHGCPPAFLVSLATSCPHSFFLASPDKCSFLKRLDSVFCRMLPPGSDFLSYVFPLMLSTHSLSGIVALVLIWRAPYPRRPELTESALM